MPDSTDPRLIVSGLNPVPNPVDTFRNALAAQQQMGDIAEQKQKVQTEQAATQARNALSQLYADPKNLTPGGGLTPNALNRVMQIDPATGMKLQKQAADMGAAQMQRTMDIQKLVAPVRDAALEAHDLALKSGKSAEAARAAGQAALDEGLKGLDQGGALSETERENMTRKFDPQLFQARALSYKDMLAERDKKQVHDDAEKDRQQVMAREDRAQAERVRHDLATEDPGSGISDEALNYAADRYRATGVLPSMGMGKAGAAYRAQVIERAANKAKETGGDAAGDIVNQTGIKADARSLGLLTAQKNAVEAFEKTAVKNGDVLADLADKVDTTGSPVIERWIRAGRREIAGDPDVTNFNAQLYLYRNEVAKILTNPNLTGVLSDNARHEVDNFLQGSATAAQIKGLIPLLKGDFDRRKESYKEQIDTVKGSIKDAAGGKGSAKLSDQDQQALDWANANPGDPRAAKIKAKLGGQ